MAKDSSNLITDAQDKCVPLKEFKINTIYKHGLTLETKELIRERDELRKNLKRTPNERKMLHIQYEKLRNRITNNIKRGTQSSVAQSNKFLCCVELLKITTSRSITHYMFFA